MWGKRKKKGGSVNSTKRIGKAEILKKTHKCKPKIYNGMDW